MTTFGITPQGFTPMRLADCIAAYQTALAQVTDPVTGQTLDVDPTNGDDSLLAQLVGILAEADADAWNMLALVYNQFDPLYNSGAGQSATVQLNGIIRNNATPCVLTLALGGTSGAYVPAGSVVQTLDGLYQFTTATTVQLPATGVLATCTTPGVMGSSTANLQIYTPVVGWSTVSVTATTQGTAAETDAALRLRQQSATSTTSYRQIDALYAGLMAVPGVTYARIFSNSTMSDAAPAAYPDSAFVVDAKSVAAIVVGGTDAAVAEALFLKTPIGVGYVTQTGSITTAAVPLTAATITATTASGTLHIHQSGQDDITLTGLSFSGSPAIVASTAAITLNGAMPSGKTTWWSYSSNKLVYTPTGLYTGNVWFSDASSGALVTALGLPGIATVAASSVTLTDVQGFSYPISFIRPAQVPVNVAVTIANIGPQYPGDTTAHADVTAAILAFAAANYTPGTTVYAGTLYGPALAAAGLNWNVTSITVNGGTSVAIDWWQQAAITVTVSG